MSFYEDVRAFHVKFGLPHFGENDNPHLLSADVDKFRANFMQEELDEYKEAVAQGDLAKAADALVDLVYVALGTAHMMHIPFNACWEEVQRANMSKERATSADDERSKRKSTLDIVKPDGWTTPDINSILEAHSK